MTDDPDLNQAIDAFRPAVLTIRVHSARLVGLAEGGSARAAEQAAIDSLVADMKGRADRLGITLDELFRHINDDLRLSPPPADHRPTGAHLRVLQAEAIRAGAAERLAHEAVTAAQHRLSLAIAARLDAQRACAGYVADQVA